MTGNLVTQMNIRDADVKTMHVAQPQEKGTWTFEETCSRNEKVSKEVIYQLPRQNIKGKTIFITVLVYVLWLQV